MLLGSALYLNPLRKPSKETVVVASKPTSEQFILGEIIAQTIENNTDIKVVRKFGIGGGTTNIHPAMLANKIDIYPEYTGTSWLSVLKKDHNLTFNFDTLQNEYLKKFKLEWLGLLGFNNSYTLAIPENLAESKNIRTFSDLAKQSKDFDFGAEFDFFERSDAYKGLIKAYSFNFKSKYEMDINLRYNAINEGKINAVDAFTTDAQIKALKLRVLEDDLNYFPHYKAGIVIRQNTLKKYPQLRKLLSKLNGKIDDDIMRAMNYKVEILKKTPKKVAEEFLLTITFD